MAALLGAFFDYLIFSSRPLRDKSGAVEAAKCLHSAAGWMWSVDHPAMQVP